MKVMKPALPLLLLMPVLALLPLSPLSPAAAHAQSRSEADCEKLAEALAYNACLAEFGPRVGERRATTAGSQQMPGGTVQRRPDGRKAASFDVITSRK